MAGNQGDKTEQPTAKRLRDARRKGQVARSRDLSQAVSLAATLAALAWLGTGLLQRLGGAVASAVARMGQAPTRDLRAEDATALVLDGLRLFAALVGPVAATAAIAGLAAHTMQGGLVLAPESLRIDWSRLSPGTNVKRLGLSKGGVALLKTAVVTAVLATIGVQLLLPQVRSGAQLARLAPLAAGHAAWTSMQQLVRQALVALVAIGAADYAVQRWRLMSSLRMTKQEVKDDFRLAEGNPEIKARVRRIQMTLVRSRMLAEVPRATVVVTNPTHFAVALEYRRGEMVAPRVVAKGRGHVAARIKAIARSHNVPTVENVPLAQALYKGVEVGESIPAALFEAVAEVLAYLIRLRQLVG